MRVVRALYHCFIPQGMPSLVAKYYERLIDSVSDFYLRPFYEEILEKYPGPTRILDIGTGTGQLPIMLARSNENYEITAVDLSEKCLKIARSKAASAKAGSRIAFTCVDLLQNNWNTESFDLIISTCSMHHWRRPVKMLSEAQQLLAENGEVWILDDLAGVSVEAQAEWIKKVERACKPKWLFRIVFSFESRFLAYSCIEVEEMCKKVGFSLTTFSTEGTFSIAQMTHERSK